MKAYAVLGSDDHFVGIWRDRETAEKVMERSALAKGERIVEMVEHTEALKASTADKEHLLHAINALCDERDALKMDAERYRKLCASGRYCPDPFGYGWGMVTGHRRLHAKSELDAAIDAAKGE